jgi:superfamily II DNA or RNA helicase
VTQLKIPFTNNTCEECNKLRRENAFLKNENIRLNEQLKLLQIKKDSQSYATASSASIVRESNSVYIAPASAQSSDDSHIKLFRNLFIGRDDVYAKHWYGEDGKSNYSPAKSHVWQKHAVDPITKKKICSESCQLLPITDKVIAEHLDGKQIIGTYPLMQGDSCKFLAVDFDKSTWQEDCLAFLETCDELAVPAYLERSRSGAGGHIWVFFDRTIPAFLARKLGTYIITRTKEKYYQLSFDSYDRLFPNQDTMPKGGFGNLIALPLQAEAGKLRNSLFVDRNFKPVDDQWELLANAVRINQNKIGEIIRQADLQAAIMPILEASDSEKTKEPWKTSPSEKSVDNTLKGQLPKQTKLIISNMLYLEKQGFGSAALNKIMRLAAFQNPEFYRAQALRMSTHETPRIICCADNHPQHIALPRECLFSLKDLLRTNKISLNIKDERFSGSAIKTKFLGTLRPEQHKAADAVLSNDNGILCASTAFGKTVVAAYAIGKRKVNTLILVHRTPLIHQWQERLKEFLDLPDKSIGQLGGGKKKLTGIIDIATIQSLNRSGKVDNAIANYGQVIIDECHHLPAFSFEQVIKQAKAKHILGLTATLIRKDGHHPIVMMHCGSVVFKDGFKKNIQASGRKYLVFTRKTNLMLPSMSDSVNINPIYDVLVNDAKRNQFIIEDILKALKEKRSPLVITERKEHLEKLAAMLNGKVKNIFVLQGGMKKKERLAIFSAIKSVPLAEERLIVATGKYIGEGFDDSRLDTLFLSLPISWKGTVRQYAGRLHREHEGKNQIQIYDYVDWQSNILLKMYEKRAKEYKEMGYEF